MAPLQTPDTAPTPPSHSVPPIHLRVLDVSHPGTELFFLATSTPGEALRTAAQRVLSTLYPSDLTSSSSSSPATPPPVRSVTLHLRAFDGVAHTCGSDLDNDHKELHLSSSYLASVAMNCGGKLDDIKHEIEGVLVHELVHAFQWDGKGTVPGGVIEGIADWVRDQVGLGALHWRENPQEDDKWDAGYSTTAYFLRWLASHFKNPHLAPQLNLAMRNHKWDGGEHLKKLCNGKDIEELWEIYRKEVKKKEDAGEDVEEPPQPVPTHGVRSGYAVQY
ncbi:hypothetical protein JCM11251_007883 [Rhodosporidiobolus azoricus]